MGSFKVVEQEAILFVGRHFSESGGASPLMQQLASSSTILTIIIDVVRLCCSIICDGKNNKEFNLYTIHFIFLLIHP